MTRQLAENVPLWFFRKSLPNTILNLLYLIFFSRSGFVVRKFGGKLTDCTQFWSLLLFFDRENLEDFRRSRFWLQSQIFHLGQKFRHYSLIFGFNMIINQFSAYKISIAKPLMRTGLQVPVEPYLYMCTFHHIHIKNRPFKSLTFKAGHKKFFFEFSGYSIKKFLFVHQSYLLRWIFA